MTHPKINFSPWMVNTRNIYSYSSMQDKNKLWHNYSSNCPVPVCRKYPKYSSGQPDLSGMKCAQVGNIPPPTLSRHQYPFQYVDVTFIFLHQYSFNTYSTKLYTVMDRVLHIPIYFFYIARSHSETSMIYSYISKYL